MVINYDANDNDTALKRKSIRMKRYRELPVGARQSGSPEKITSELSDQTIFSSKSERLITVTLSHIDGYVTEWLVFTNNESGTAEENDLCLLIEARVFLFY